MSTNDAHRDTLHEAISILAGVCDYANERDRAGFSSADATIGHYLADVPADSWIPEHLLTSQKLVRKYRRQLAGHPALGLVDHKFTPVADPMSDDDLEAVYDNAREVTRRGGELHRARARIAAGSSLLVDGATVSLTFPYDEELIAESRIIAGRTYDPDTKSNRYPITSLSAVIAFSDRHGIAVDDETRTLATAVDADPRAYAKPNVTVDGTIFTIDCPFVDGLASALRTLNGNKTTWDGATRTHRLPLTCDRDVLSAPRTVRPDRRRRHRKPPRGGRHRTAHRSRRCSLAHLPHIRHQRSHLRTARQPETAGCRWSLANRPPRRTRSAP